MFYPKKDHRTSLETKLRRACSKRLRSEEDTCFGVEPDYRRTAKLLLKKNWRQQYFTLEKVMKRSLVEMTSDWFGSSTHQSKNGSDMTVFERQQNQMKLLQQQQQHQGSTSDTHCTAYPDQAPKIQGSKQTQNLRAGDIGLQNTITMLDHCLGWPELGHISMPTEKFHSSFDCGNKCRLETKTSSHTLGKSTGFPPKKIVVEKDGDNSNAAVTPKSDLEIIEENMKRRKMDQFPQLQVPRAKLSSDNSKEMSSDASNGNSRRSKVAKPDYIQVRARPGQATDRHSLAERVRREKISQKMRFLQDLVPGCNMITGKTGMLDEIINYVQALQSQVEFLSMKLATVTTAVNFSSGSKLKPEVHAEKAPTNFRVTLPDACSANFPLNQLQEFTISETILHSSSTKQLSTTNTPTWAHDNSQDTACFASIPAWDADFQALPGSEFHQQKYYNFPSQPAEGDSTSMSESFTML